MKKILGLIILAFLLVGCENKSIKVLKNSYEVLVDEVIELEYETDEEVELISSNLDVLKIVDGKVFGVGVGTAQVTIKTSKGKTKVTVKVNENPMPVEERAFHKALNNTKKLLNFTVKITLKEVIWETEDISKETSYTFYYKFDGSKYEFSGRSHPIYYEFKDEKYHKYEMTLDGYQEIVVNETFKKPFFIDLNYEDFDYLNNAYFLKYGNEEAFLSFYEEFPNAILTNGRITVDDYIKTISFSLTMPSEEIYQLLFEFVDINNTSVVIPQ